MVPLLKRRDSERCSVYRVSVSACVICMRRPYEPLEQARCAERVIVADFRLQAERALGHPIDVISGLEEALLIYRGCCTVCRRMTVFAW